MSTPLRYERIGAAAVLTITRPERRNAIDGATSEAIVERVREFEGDPGARVLVVTGDDQAFCAGADLKALDTLAPRVGSVEGVFGARRFPAKPAIAAISGWCLGGGLSLATWCDLRIAATTARFGFTDRRWGAPILDGAAVRLVAIVGLGRALDLVLTGREISAEDALAFGLITEIVPARRHLERALELAEMIAGFPQETLLSDRAGLLEDIGKRLEATAERDRRALGAVLHEAEAAPARFASRRGSRPPRN